MNKHIFILTFGILFFQITTAQNLSSHSISIGKNLQRDTEIKAEEYDFDQYLQDIHIDSALNILTLHLVNVNKKKTFLKNSGQIANYDLRNKQKLWSQEINFSQYQIKYVENLLLYQQIRRGEIKTLQTGHTIQSNDLCLIYFNHPATIGIGFSRNAEGNPKNKLVGWAIYSGQELWQRPIQLSRGIDRIIPLTDTTILLEASGLHQVNLNTGKGWSYTSKTSKKEVGKALGIGALGIVSGILTGVAVVPTRINVISGYRSNLITESTGYYMAFREELVNLSLQGEVIWQASLPQNVITSSSIFVQDSVLYLLNHGSLKSGNRVISGLPFLTAYQKTTGRQLYNTVLGNEQNPVIDFQLKHDTLNILFERELKKYALPDGHLISSYRQIADSIKDFKFFLSPAVCTSIGNSYHSLIPLNPSDYFLATQNNQVIHLDPDLEYQEFIPRSKLFPCILTYKGHRFLGGIGKTIVIDPQGKAIAELDITINNPILNGSDLYCTQNYTLQIIDLKQFIPEELLSEMD